MADTPSGTSKAFHLDRRTESSRDATVKVERVVVPREVKTAISESLRRGSDSSKQSK